MNITKRIATTLIILTIFQFITLMAQGDAEKDYGISFSGYVKTDFTFDTRQTVAPREGHFFLWPANIYRDSNGNDINDKPSFNFFALQSRLKGSITGPDAFGAKTSGALEGDFFAQSDANIHLFRLRHAFLKFSWTNLEILTGQYWNPMFVTDAFPGVLAFNTGAPMQSFGRNPQIRLTYTAGKVRLIGALLAQRDHASRGVNGASSEYLRNSLFPDAHAQIHFLGNGIIAGVGTAYKTIVPRLTNNDATNLYKVTEKVSGLTLMGFGKITTDFVTIKVQGRYGENIPDLLSISGFAVKEVLDPLTGESSYTPLQNTAFWGDFHTNGDTWQAGIFGGYLKNMGTKESMSSPTNSVYGLGTDIASLFRIAPRIMFNSGKARIAAEVDYTAAEYGSNFDVNYMPATTETVSNIRFLLSTYLFF